MKFLPPTFEFEDPYYRTGSHVAGIDEVGRGSLAGPLVVGLVIFSPTDLIQKNELLHLGIHDSKLLTPKMRETLAQEIKNRASFSALSFMSSDEINTIGISACLGQAVIQLMGKAIQHCQKKQISFLIDGLPISHIPYRDRSRCEFIVKGDMKSISIAAASILAKVERDAYMTQLAESFPAFDWAVNKGYGTKKHRDAIQNFGSTPHHRTLYIRNIIKNHPTRQITV